MTDPFNFGNTSVDIPEEPVPLNELLQQLATVPQKVESFTHEPVIIFTTAVRQEFTQFAPALINCTGRKVVVFVGAQSDDDVAGFVKSMASLNISEWQVWGYRDVLETTNLRQRISDLFDSERPSHVFFNDALYQMEDVLRSQQILRPKFAPVCLAYFDTGFAGYNPVVLNIDQADHARLEILHHRAYGSGAVCNSIQTYRRT